MPTLQSFSAYTPHLNSWVYSNTQGTKGITNLMLSRNLCEFFPLQSLENAFSALELYRLYIIVHFDILFQSHNRFQNLHEGCFYLLFWNTRKIYPTKSRYIFMQCQVLYPSCKNS